MLCRTDEEPGSAVAPRRLKEMEHPKQPSNQEKCVKKRSPQENARILISENWVIGRDDWKR